MFCFRYVNVANVSLIIHFILKMKLIVSFHIIYYYIILHISNKNTGSVSWKSVLHCTENYQKCIGTVSTCIVLMLYCTPSFYHSLHNISISFPIIIALHHGHVVCLLSSRREYVRSYAHARISPHARNSASVYNVYCILYIYLCVIYTHVYILCNIHIKSTKALLVTLICIP